MQLVRGVEFEGKRFPFFYTLLDRREDAFTLPLNEALWMKPWEIPPHWRKALGEEAVREIYGTTA